MESKRQTLIELLDRLDDLDDALTIYAEENPDWHAGSLAIVAESVDRSVPAAAQGLSYFLEVFIAKEVAEGFNYQVGRPTRDEICDRITIMLSMMRNGDSIHCIQRIKQWLAADAAIACFSW